MQTLDVVNSAVKRAEHFSNAVAWYSTALREETGFQEQFLLLAQALVDCAREAKTSQQVLFMAVGKSAQVAQLAVSMLVSVGIVARFVNPTDAYHGDLGVVGENDAVVLISNNGASSELLQLLPGLQVRKVRIFTVTSKSDSPLAKSAQHLLLIAPFSEFCPLNNAPITSTITTLALCQLLVAATMELRQYPLEEYAKNHPGGAIGKRIFLKVDDLISGQNIPTVLENDIFKNVVSKLTDYSKGAVLVVNSENKFLGLITEKDLRRAMEQGPSAFNLVASDFMNTKPTIVHPGTLAINAFQVMHSHNPQMNVLPIIDTDGNAVGILRMLDLVSAGVTSL